MCGVGGYWVTALDKLITDDIKANYYFGTKRYLVDMPKAIAGSINKIHIGAKTIKVFSEYPFYSVKCPGKTTS